MCSYSACWGPQGRPDRVACTGTKSPKRRNPKWICANNTIALLAWLYASVDIRPTISALPTARTVQGTHAPAIMLSASVQGMPDATANSQVQPRGSNIVASRRLDKLRWRPGYFHPALQGSMYRREPLDVLYLLLAIPVMPSVKFV